MFYYILLLGNVCREERFSESHFTAGCFSAAHRCCVFRSLSDVGAFRRVPLKWRCCCQQLKPTGLKATAVKSTPRTASARTGGDI